MSNTEVTPGMMSDAEAESLSARILRLELLLQSFSRQHIYSPDANGTMSRFEVLASNMGSDSTMQEALSPFFVVENDTLYGLVAPHAMLSPDLSDMFQPVVPTLGGVKVNADPAPRVALKDGKWYLTIKAGHGVATVDFTQDLPKRETHIVCADWALLAEFDVEENTRVKNLRRHNASWQHGLRRPEGFAPLLWRDGNTWKALVVGHVIDRTKMAKIEVKWSGTVKEGDMLYRKIQTGFDGDLLACTIHHQPSESDPPEDQQHLPTLSNQKGRDGRYHIPLCRFSRTNDAGKDNEQNPIFTLYPEMFLAGDLVWQPESYQNIGGGEAKLLKDTNLFPRKLKVRSIKKGNKDQIQVEQLDGEVEIRGNGKNGQLVWQNCDGYPTTLLEWVDGLITNEGAVTFKAGCVESSTDAPGP